MLLVRPQPYNDESLESYLLRLSFENGFADFKAFWKGIRTQLLETTSLSKSALPEQLKLINPYHANHSSAQRLKGLKLISQFANLEPYQLLSLAMYRGGITFSGRFASVFRKGIVIPMELMRKKGCPICPICIKEYGYIKQIWHFIPIVSCHLHHTQLVSHCECGHLFDYVEDEDINRCARCEKPIVISKTHLESTHSENRIAAWLSDLNPKELMNIAVSHRWGVANWWHHTFNCDELFNMDGFYVFLREWPDCLYRHLDEKRLKATDYAIKPIYELSFQEVFGHLLRDASALPSSRLNENIVLAEIVKYLGAHVFDADDMLYQLKLNSIEAAIILGTSIEQVAALVDQGELVISSKLKAGAPLNKYWKNLVLGDVFCLWLARFQTDCSYYNTYTSTW